MSFHLQNVCSVLVVRGRFVFAFADEDDVLAFVVSEVVGWVRDEVTCGSSAEDELVEEVAFEAEHVYESDLEVTIDVWFVVSLLCFFLALPSAKHLRNKFIK